MITLARLSLWPPPLIHPAVRDVIKEVGSTELELGLEIGLRNNRGMVSKHPLEGGAQERQLADRYAEFAGTISHRWPHTAGVLLRIADRYRADAQREDQRAELREDPDRWP